jgi:hypothetical protein
MVRDDLRGVDHRLSHRPPWVLASFSLESRCALGGAGDAESGYQRTMTRKWRQKSDPLFRGDHADAVGLPSPSADDSIVRHILYLEGAGRKTPYLSTTELHEIAEHFGGRTGRVWKVMFRRLQDEGLTHISRIELLDLLNGRGKGRATWRSALEVALARRYAEQWYEHLIDFSPLAPIEDSQLRKVVDRCFDKA